MSFNINVSIATGDVLAEFLANPSPTLLDVPGIGPKTVQQLRDRKDGGAPPINNIYQLFGQFLLMHEGGSTQEHHDAFFFWLKQVGVHHANKVTHAISEKLAIAFPGGAMEN